MKKTSDILVKMLVIVGISSSLFLETQAFLWWGKEKDVEETVEDFQVVVRSTEDFSPSGFGANVSEIVIETLPYDRYGLLLLDGNVVQVQESIPKESFGNLSFESKSTIGVTEFQYTPLFTDGKSGETVTMEIWVIDVPNTAPIAKDMDLFTYKNIEIVCYFDVSDRENDILSFQIVDPPARGSVEISETGASSFLYKPYENKVGKDAFTYIVTDSFGNESEEATVNIVIEKANTPVVYGDMAGNSAHKAAISLAESSILVGECVGGVYLFHPDEVVTREEFLSLAMAVADLAPITDVSVTGFYDDDSISTWSKGYVASALVSGVIQGSSDDAGRPVFQGDGNITLAEASVILNQLMDISEVAETSSTHWASQASANIASVGVSTVESRPLPASLNRGEVAELLDGALALFKEKEDTWLSW